MAAALPDEMPQLSLEQMHALILSRHYWPTALAKEDDPSFKLPPVLEEALADYSRMYARVRAKRSLHWKRAQGRIDVTIQLADRALKLEVTPMHLSVLSCFDSEAGQAAQLSLQDVVTQLELPEAQVRKRLNFWVSKGVLREVATGVFEVQESLSAAEGGRPGGGGGPQQPLDVEDVEHSPGQVGGAARGPAGRDGACAKELEGCEAFVQAMLTNYASLQLGRIHNFLQMFMVDPPYTQTEEQLRDFLTVLCQEGRLEFNGSSYALAKKA